MIEIRKILKEECAKKANTLLITLQKNSLKEHFQAEIRDAISSFTIMYCFAFPCLRAWVRSVKRPAATWHIR
jgi:hypothetical protein